MNRAFFGTFLLSKANHSPFLLKPHSTLSAGLSPKVKVLAERQIGSVIFPSMMGGLVRRGRTNRVSAGGLLISPFLSISAQHSNPTKVNKTTNLNPFTITSQPSSLELTAHFRKHLSGYRSRRCFQGTNSDLQSKSMPGRTKTCFPLTLKVSRDSPRPSVGSTHSALATTFPLLGSIAKS